MEVFPCSGVQCVGESNCTQRSSGTTFIYNGESNCVKHGNQTQATCSKLDVLSIDAEGPRIKRQARCQETVAELPTLEGRYSGSSCCDSQMGGQKISSRSKDCEDDEVNAHNCCTRSCLASESSHLILDTIESELPSYSGEEASSPSEPKWLVQDETVAVWVKWKGKWHAGIKCARADWPLSMLKAKPTHDRKKYFVIFLPHMRNYIWADMLLVRSINEFPQPIAYKTHEVGFKLVKDLSTARRFIMQKLAVEMLNIVDQFHIGALVETARDVMVWKEFAMEASRCIGYSDLGKMLLKLQNMILRCYINSDWLECSFESWAQRCQAALNAEFVEMLMEELLDSIQWDEVNSLRDAPVQSSLGSEWKTWKHEVMEWFSTSHPISSIEEIEQSSDGPLTTTLQVSRKRAKLEVRRADAHSSVLETKVSNQAIAVEIKSQFFDNCDAVNVATLASQPCKEEEFSEGSSPTHSPGSVADKLGEIVVKAGDSEFIPSKDAELTPVNEIVSRNSFDSGNNSRRCTAFIESKGRQCVRWATDGDVYCCVHLASRFLSNCARAEGTSSVDTPMCEGTTVLGTRCKHRSLYGSTFCKKHRPRNDTSKTSILLENIHKRKPEVISPTSEIKYSKDNVLVEEVESPLQVNPVSFMKGDAIHGINNLYEKPEHSGGGKDGNGKEALHCIGSCAGDNSYHCLEKPTKHSLYCEKHLPSWLKRARNGKSRIISKEVFMNLLSDCCTWEQKLHLHEACELFYRLFKSVLSLRNPVPIDVQLQWALSEASKDYGIGEFVVKLVSAEKERLRRIWGFGYEEEAQVFSSAMEVLAPLPLTIFSSRVDEITIKCKICSEEFTDDQALGNHWMDNHKEEAQCLLRGYACAICFDSFTDEKVLETHVKERHHVQFVEQCMLLQCISCGIHFGNTEELCLHVLSVHPAECRLSKVAQQQMSVVEDFPLAFDLGYSASAEKKPENLDGFQKFVCRFCGLKFDLLPDLDRHHQAAHVEPNLASSHTEKKSVPYYARGLKSGRLSCPGFKKGLGAASYGIRNRGAASMKKRIQTTKSLSILPLNIQPHVNEESLGTLAESHCSTIAKILHSEVQKTKPRPSDHEILSTARSVCCKFSLTASLEGRYGALPECLYLKAAKLCSEQNIQVNWHEEGFICPNGCKRVNDPHFPAPLTPLPKDFLGHSTVHSSYPVIDQWEVDECHYIVNLHQFEQKGNEQVIVLCDDISFGQESVPVPCVVDEVLLDCLQVHVDNADGQNRTYSMPWESFTYITRPLLDESLGRDPESLQFGCACPHSACCPETCGHVYLFDNDYEDAKDIFGKPLRGRFPYDGNGRIIVEEGYLVYECNYMCSCSRTCPNRVLQNGVQVKLEIFKTEKKGWAIRAGEAISRGTFVCEYIGEVIEEHEANERRKRNGTEGCSYFYDLDAHSNDVGRLIGEQIRHVIDATKYGNVSRFINHSCLPNLVNYQVLVESMDSQRSHIGLYASRDIALGEELTHNYREKDVHANVIHPSAEDAFTESEIVLPLHDGFFHHAEVALH